MVITKNEIRLTAIIGFDAKFGFSRANVITSA